MLVELETFLEFGENWWDEGPKTRDRLVFGKVTLNTEYISWLRRFEIGELFSFCEVHMVDRGCCFTVTKSYEEMRELLKVPAAA